jgi:hypothetical protein
MSAAEIAGRIVGLTLAVNPIDSTNPTDAETNLLD